LPSPPNRSLNNGKIEIKPHQDSHRLDAFKEPQFDRRRRPYHNSALFSQYQDQRPGLLGVFFIAAL